MTDDPQPDDQDLPASLDRAAARIGSSAWLAMRLFETVGGWVSSTADPALKALYADLAAHFGWHAELWWDRLPELRERDRQSYVVAAPGASALVEVLGGDTREPDRLAMLARVVLPRLAVALRAELHRLSPLSDAPAIRAARLVLRDVRADWAACEAALEPNLADEASVEAAAHAAARLEAAVVRAGGCLVGAA